MGKGILNRMLQGQVARAVYAGPPGQDPEEMFEICEPPPAGHDFVDEVSRHMSSPRGQ